MSKFHEGANQLIPCAIASTDLVKSYMHHTLVGSTLQVQLPLFDMLNTGGSSSYEFVFERSHDTHQERFLSENLAR